MLSQYEAPKLKMFDEFLKNNNQRVEEFTLKEVVYMTTYTCTFYLKHSMCKHILGELIQ